MSLVISTPDGGGSGRLAEEFNCGATDWAARFPTGITKQNRQFQRKTGTFSLGRCSVR